MTTKDLKRKWDYESVEEQKPPPQGVQFVPVQNSDKEGNHEGSTSSSLKRESTTCSTSTGQKEVRLFGSGFTGTTSFGHVAAAAASRNNDTFFVSSTGFEKQDETTVEASDDDDEENEAPQEVEPITPLQPPPTLITGEEHEETQLSIRARLYVLDKEMKDWKERGVGILRLNAAEEIEQLRLRLVMRAEGTFRLLLNVFLFKDMYIEIVHDTHLRLAVLEEDQSIQHYLIRLKSAEEAQNLYSAIVNGCSSLRSTHIDANTST
jgi:hypothetical protein